MSTTGWILVGVAVAAVGIVAWLLLTPADAVADQAAVEVVLDVEPTIVEPDPIGEPASDEPGSVEPTEASDVAVEPEPVQPVTAPATSAALGAIDGVIDLGEYRNEMVVSDVAIYWLNDANTLRMALEAPGTGYVSIGFDPDNRMEGANYIIGYVEEGVAYLRDDFGTGPTMHSGDTERGGTDNILASGGTEWADHTVLEFIIPLDSGDEMDKPLVPGQTYEILVAYHDLQDGFSLRHSRRGSGQLTLEAAP